MPIPTKYQGRFVYHFCQIQNLPSVLEHGLLSCNQQTVQGIEHRSIAAADIQNRRSTMCVTCGPGSVVHDYVPFYFCKRSSMLLAVVQAKNVDQQMLVYLAVPITVIERDDVVFTSASANTIEPPAFFADPEDLSKLDWDAIDSLKWTMPTEQEKQARMAEILVFEEVNLNLVDHIIVWNKSFRDIVEEYYKKKGCKAPDIRYGYEYLKHYFNRYPEEPYRSLVTGPFFTKRDFDNGVKDLQAAIGTAMNQSYQRLSELRDALRENLEATPLTGELVGLVSDNPMHPEDAGVHTQEVVDNLLKSEEFASLKKTDQLLIEIAAYCHDVGKGPKSRWKNNDGKQKVDPDHAVRAVPMVAEFLKDQVANTKLRSARIILMLVCYHDLVGDIIGKGREEEQLFDIITDEHDLDMLIALAKADVQAIHDQWWDQTKVDELRQRAIKTLKAKEQSKDV